MSTFKRNREEWLNDVVRHVSPWFEAAGAPLPRFRVTCGWTGRGKSKKAQGQCWPPTASKDGTTEIFVSPIIDDPLAAAEVLMHEIIHAAVGVEAKHGPAFKHVALALGFRTPMTSTPASPELKERLRQVIESVGPYPHAAMDFEQRQKEGTRLIKAVCPHCGYTVRVTNIWASTGAPVCPNHLTVMMLIGSPAPETTPVEGVRNVGDVFGMLIERMTEDELRRLAGYLKFFDGEAIEPGFLLGSEPEISSESDLINELLARLKELKCAMQKAHPDRGGNHDEFIEIRRMYEQVKRELHARQQERETKKKQEAA
jgi:hypothetical protein